MKRNLISVIILAFSIINFILLAIIVFTVIPTNKKTDNLITSIASIVDLSLESENGSSSSTGVSLDQLTTYDMEDELTITLTATDGTVHYAVVTASIQMNSTSEDYETYDPTLETGISAKASIIEAKIQDIIGSHTYEECTTGKEEIRQECLQAIKDMFNGSDVIYDFSFTKWVLS